jgi:nickel superoxide dismutase
MKKTGNFKLLLLSLISIVGFVPAAYSHCQIPCGIYDDPARFEQISEHIKTVEKSMKQIVELSQKDKPNFNQIVRWVRNKEVHADNISEILTHYFMSQRLKPVKKNHGEEYEQYVRKLTLLHEMLFYSMKAKQTTETKHIEKIKTLLEEFKNAYFQK